MRFLLLTLILLIGCFGNPVDQEEIQTKKHWTGFHYDSSIVIDSWTAMDNRRKIYATGYVVNHSVYDIIMTPKLHAYVLDSDTTGMVVEGNPIYIGVGDTMRVHVETDLFIPPWYYRPRGEFEFIGKRWVVSY